LLSLLLLLFPISLPQVADAMAVAVSARRDRSSW
jgi:hypothetical protein